MGSDYGHASWPATTANKVTGKQSEDEEFGKALVTQLSLKVASLIDPNAGMEKKSICI